MIEVVTGGLVSDFQSPCRLCGYRPLTGCWRRCLTECPSALTRVRVRSSRLSAQGEHLLHVLNTLGSRKVVLEAELKEIDEDIVQNAAMTRKYGDEFFTEGTARLAQTRVRCKR